MNKDEEALRVNTLLRGSTARMGTELLLKRRKTKAV